VEGLDDAEAAGDIGATAGGEGKRDAAGEAETVLGGMGSGEAVRVVDDAKRARAEEDGKRVAPSARGGWGPAGRGMAETSVDGLGEEGEGEQGTDCAGDADDGARGSGESEEVEAEVEREVERDAASRSGGVSTAVPRVAFGESKVCETGLGVVLEVLSGATTTGEAGAGRDALRRRSRPTQKTP